MFNFIPLITQPGGLEKIRRRRNIKEILHPKKSHRKSVMSACLPKKAYENVVYDRIEFSPHFGQLNKYNRVGIANEIVDVYN